MKITLYCAPDETVEDGLRDFLRIAKAKGLKLKRVSHGGSGNEPRAIAADLSRTERTRKK